MATKANTTRKEANDNFGLPKAEFKPIEYGNKNWLKITAIIVSVVLIVSTGLIYWFFFRDTPNDTLLVEEHEIHSESNDIEFIENELPEEQPFEEEGLEDHVSEPDPQAASTTPQPQAPPKGTVTKITTPQGHYYVVVGSFIDGALAEDLAKQLAKQGASAIILYPKANAKYYRVAIDQGSTFAEANATLEEHKATHGANLWILKY